MNTLLLLALPWGYLVAALFLLIAVILFIVAIFMKDTGELNEEQINDGTETQAYDNASYEDSFDRYKNVADMQEEETLQTMIAETAEPEEPVEDLSETRMFTPVGNVPPDEPEEVATFEDFSEPEEEFANEDEDADVKRVELSADSEPEVEEPVTEEPIVEEPVVVAQALETEEDEFEEVAPPKKSLFGRREEEDSAADVPKPVEKQKSGMSFAEEVRRLIEEEERRNKNS